MVTAKSKRKDLEVPDFVRDEWANGNRSAMAKILQDVNWNKADRLKLCQTIGKPHDMSQKNSDLQAHSKSQIPICMLDTLRSCQS